HRRSAKSLELLESRTLLSVGQNPYAGAYGPSISGSSSGYVQGQSTAEETPTYLPTQHSLFDYDGYLTGPSADAPLEIATDFRRSHAVDLGLSPADLDGLVVTDQYTTSITGTTHLYFRQTFYGLPIVNANADVNVDAQGRIINAASTFVHDVGSQIVSPSA